MRVVIIKGKSTGRARKRARYYGVVRVSLREQRLVLRSCVKRKSRTIITRLPDDEQWTMLIYGMKRWAEVQLEGPTLYLERTGNLIYVRNPVRLGEGVTTIA